VWWSQKAFSVPFHVFLWPGIGHIQDTNRPRISIQQRLNCLTHLFDIGSI